MKTHVNNYFIRTTTKTTSISSGITRSPEQKTISYLILERSKHKRRNEISGSKLPQIQLSQLRAKTETDQPTQLIMDPKLSIAITSRKEYTSQIFERIKTQPSIQVFEPDLIQEKEILDMNAPKYFDILCEELILKNKNTKVKKQKKWKCQIKLNEIEKILDKGSKLCRKIVALYKTNREKTEEQDIIRTKTISETKFTKSLFTTYATNAIQDNPNSPKEPFHQQLSAIPQKQTKVNSQITLRHQDSFKPMRSLVEAIKEKQIDQKQQKSSIPDNTPKFEITRKSKIVVTIECSQETKINKIEFHIPQYMEDIQETQIQIPKIIDKQQSLSYPDGSPQMRTLKKSNIYSLFSKNMFNKKLSKIAMNDNLYVDNFNSDKANQFIRYYLQNLVLKFFSVRKKENQLFEDYHQNQNMIVKGESNRLDIGTYISRTCIENTIIRVFTQLKQFDINSQLYRCPEPYDSSSSLDMSSIIDDKIDSYASEFSQDYGLSLNFLSESQNIMKPIGYLNFIVSSISDESKNQMLHQEMLYYQRNFGDFYHQKEDIIDPDNEQISNLYCKIKRKDKKNQQNILLTQYEYIIIGQYENYCQLSTNQKERILLRYCFQYSNNNNSILDTSLRSNMLKSKNKENTTDTIPKPQSNIMTLSLPPTVKSRSESPSHISEANTYINVPSQQKKPYSILKKKQFKQQKQATLQKDDSQKLLMVQQAQKNASQPVIAKIHAIQTLPSVQEQIEKKKESPQQRANSPNQTPYQKQLSMDPFSLLFRNMIISQTIIEDKSLVEKVFKLIEDHKLQDLKDIIKQEKQIAINSQDENGNTLLILAAKAGSASIVSFLLEKGADPHITNFQGQSAIEVALSNFHFQAADLIDQQCQKDSNQNYL